MDIITCPSTDDFKVFPGGAVAIRAAAYPGAARGTLAEITSSEAMSGSYLEDTQEVPWAGITHFESLDPLDADDTVTIDPSTVDLVSSMFYWPFVTARLQGVAGAGTPGDADSGRAVEPFWYYDPFVFAIYCDDSDFLFGALGENTLPRNQTQFSLIRMSGAANVLDPTASDWRFRLLKREVQGGTVALQIEQIIVLPVTVPFVSTKFSFGNTGLGDAVVETEPETSLESGIYTLDQGQPRANSFAEVNDLQDNDGTDPEVSVENLPPVIPKSFYYIGGGIVHVPKGNIEDDTFDRSVTIEPPFCGTGGCVNAAWGDSPYGFRWRVGDDTLGIGLGVTETDIGVNGSEGVISRVQDNDVDPDPADSSDCFWLIMAGRDETGTDLGPSVGDCRDHMIEAEVEWDALPASYFELDVGQFVFEGGVESGVSSRLTVRLRCESDGDLNLFFNRWYYSQAGSTPVPGPPTSAGAWSNKNVDQDWPTPSNIGTYTPGDIVHLKFARRGYDVYGRAWFDGDTEPSTWQIQERIQVPYLAAGVVTWDDYDYPQGDTLRFAWLPNGDPGLRVAVDPLNQDPGIEVLCHRFKVDFWQDEDAEFDPTDVFLRVNETGSATVLGAELNMEWKSQNWVFVGKRTWPNIDIYQWNDVDSIPLQWMSTGLTYYRKTGFVPQIYRRVFG